MRAVLAVVAVAVLGWLAVMERDLRLEQSGAAALAAGSDRADLVRAERDLRAARLLNPDTEPDVRRALVHRALGEPERALAVIEGVVRREPDNLRAWATLALLARGVDEAAVERAGQARLRLDPLNARR